MIQRPARIAGTGIPGATFTTKGTVKAVAVAANSTVAVALNLTLIGPSCNTGTSANTPTSTAGDGEVGGGGGDGNVDCGIALWQLDDPALHTCNVSIAGSDGSLDSVVQKFGVRTVQFSASRKIAGTADNFTESFQFNGAPLKMLGGCVHHANGALGAMAIDAADARRVAKLKAAGYNAIRTSHNPPSQAFLDAADAHGVLILDEAFDCWAQGKNPEDYHVAFEAWWQRDMTAMVRRDRNHPSGKCAACCAAASSASTGPTTLILTEWCA